MCLLTTCSSNRGSVRLTSTAHPVPGNQEFCLGIMQKKSSDFGLSRRLANYPYCTFDLNWPPLNWESFVLSFYPCNWLRFWSYPTVHWVNCGIGSKTKTIAWVQWALPKKTKVASQFGILVGYRSVFFRYFTNRYRRKTWSGHFGIVHLVGTPFLPQREAFAPFLMDQAPLLREK